MQRMLEEMEREEERQEARRRAEADLYLKVNYYEVRCSSPGCTSFYDLDFHRFFTNVLSVHQAGMYYAYRQAHCSGQLNRWVLCKRDFQKTV